MSRGTFRFEHFGRLVIYMHLGQDMTAKFMLQRALLVPQDFRMRHVNNLRAIARQIS